MERKLSFSVVELKNAAVLAQSEDALVLKVCKQGGGFMLNCEGFDQFRYLCCDIEMLDSHSQPFFMHFWKKGAKADAPSDFRVMSGIQPRLPMTWSFDFQLLDSQSLFPYRTPGRQKMVIYGKRTAIGELGRAYLRVKESFHDIHIRFSNLRLTTDAPDYLKPDIKLLDEMGQYIPGNWLGKQSSVDEMVKSIKKQYEQAMASGEGFATESWSRWGGWKEKKVTEGTGFFSTHNDGRRFWLVDPDGYMFFSIGPDCIGGDRDTRVDVMEHVLKWIPTEGEYPEAVLESNDVSLHNYKMVDYPMINLMRAFGGDWKEKWQRMTARRLKAWGLNTVGNWTNVDFCRASGLPYVIPLDTGRHFPTTAAKIFRDFPDVFSEEYRKNAEKYAQALLPFRGDPYLIGYFLCNEPNWAFEEGLNLGAEVMAYDGTLACKDKLVGFLTERYIDIKALNAAWGTAFKGFEELKKPIKDAHQLSASSNADLGDFMGLLVKEYVSVPSAACRKVDPNHLNLGMRWGWIHDPRQVAGWECFDVFSINCYNTDPRGAIEAVAKAGVNKPVMIGEFHHGALDGATSATGIRGVLTQHERGKAYRFFVESGASTTNLVGCHYFTWNDQSAVGRFDGENYNIGFVDACHQPYTEMVDAAIATAAALYPVADGRQEPFADKPEEIPAIFY